MEVNEMLRSKMKLDYLDNLESLEEFMMEFETTNNFSTNY